MAFLVIKYGGHAMEDPELAKDFAQSMKALRDAGHLLVLGHGGGPQINEMLAKLSIESHFVKGMRYTGPEVMNVVEMVLRGQVSSWLLTLFNEAGIRTVALSGKDCACLKARQIPELGLVGEVIAVDTTLFRTLLLCGFTPLISPIGYGEGGISLNINADIATGAVAGALKADAFVLVTDVAGVLNKDKELIHTLTLADIAKLKQEEVITGGMIPKVDSCINALEKGCSHAFIVDGRTPRNLEALFIEGKAIGTRIIP